VEILRNEIKHLVWEDLHLDGPNPYIEVRAETAKNKKSAVLPLIPMLADALRERYARRAPAFPRVFRKGIPSVKTLTKDLVACGILPVDGRGRRVDYHALRHTFATILAKNGVPRRIAMELMRHSDSRLTDQVYVDTNSLGLFNAVTQLSPPPGSPIGSPKIGKNGANLAKDGNSRDFRSESKIVAIDDPRPTLGKAVPSWESGTVVPRGGLEPQIIRQQKSFVERALSCLAVR
jgi:hypothetical protein